MKNPDRIEEVLHTIIEAAGNKYLTEVAEFIIKHCGNPDCDTCKELRNLIDE